MEANIVSIGNSKGIRIPAQILKQCGFGTKVNLEVKGNQITLTPAEVPRQGWEEAFRQAAARLAEDDPAIYADALDLDKMEKYLDETV